MTSWRHAWCSRTPVGGFLLALLPALASAACSPAASGACGECASGEVCAPDNRCRRVCTTKAECAAGQECAEGLCYNRSGGGDEAGGDDDFSHDDPLGNDSGPGDAAGPDDSLTGDDGLAEPCSACAGGLEVCVAGQCLPACGSGGICPLGSECVSPGGYCVVSAAIRLRGGSAAPTQRGTGGIFQMRGALAPYGGRLEGGSLRLLPAYR